MPDPKIKYNREIKRDLNNPLSPSAFDKFKKEQRSAIKGIRKGGVSATNLAAGLKGKAKAKKATIKASLKGKKSLSTRQAGKEAAKKSGTSVKQAKASLRKKFKKR